MNQQFGRLETMEYPGRFVLLGRNGDFIITAYGVTARNAASKAKKYLYRPEAAIIDVESTDHEMMSKGDLSLLQYTAFRFIENAIVFGNGRQVDAIIPNRGDVCASNVLDRCLQDWSYEQDKYATPRVTGLVMKNGNEETAALSIIRSKDDGSVSREIYEIPLISGEGKMLTTYDGKNERPTPSFQGPPFPVRLEATSAEALAKEIFGLLEPKEGKEDLRVSVMCVFQEILTGKRDIHVMNTSS